MKEKAKPTIGGGAKKILYTLKTVKRIGLRESAKALTAKNTCKACGLGMGGQNGGMTNEQGEFPAVCNKSVQAQSTDIQQPIPEEIFSYSLADLQDLSAHELEHLGRLNTPLFKAKNSDKFVPITWDWGIRRAAEHFAKVPAERSFFYSSGRSSNEAGFVLQLLARLYGTNNVNNCSYYCHQATGVGLAKTIGTGTSTVELADLDGCDCIFVIGANPASNHPRFVHKLQACRARGGTVIIINPAKEPGLVRFALPKSPKSLIIGGDEIASHYLQPHIGSDIGVLKGIAKVVIEAHERFDSVLYIYTHWIAFFTFSLVSGSDFFAYPRLNPTGNELCWIQWQHPNMPWDQSELMLASVTNGKVTNVRKIISNPNESLMQPHWAHNGDLYVISDRSDWWNIYQAEIINFGENCSMFIF